MIDYLIIGAGISGAAAAYELASHGSVVLVEAEASAGFHSTGRSAALYTPNYGSELVRRINRLSHGFLLAPPEGFCRQPLLSPRGMLSVASIGQESELSELIAQGGAEVEWLDAAQTLSLAPFLREERVIGAAYEAGVADMDVDALHQGFLKGMRQRGGELWLDSKVSALLRKDDGWQVDLGERQLRARIVVNAAGAWADEVAELAGIRPVRLVPRRRTAILVDPPAGLSLANVPALDFIGVDNYIKPDAGQLMVSPGDETPVVPHDVQPDDMDVAVLVDWLENETRLEVRRLEHQWAGLRSFVADGAPAVGFDSAHSGFFWLAAQGGYGIMMSSALARASASLITQSVLPQDFLDAGVTASELSVNRLREPNRG
ncbi:NAD(P)/FAD-dependent oxidoreductase [Granulosicoccus sp. 3-233]|uniref:NAD(P)/FAD-dependent oxidoreductase n=1 Tax=Granulosicoccus sp. 3-233 TaxID=3417969 RepID=UPI003D340292